MSGLADDQAARLAALDSVLHLYRGTDPPDTDRWHTARTLLDLAELTACWLERGLSSHPGYGDPGDGPDDETTRLVPALAVLNRAGWLTDQSQPGHVAGRAEQRAAVSGFTHPDLADRVAEAAGTAGLIAITSTVDRRWWMPADRWSGVVVSLEQGHLLTVFGSRPHRRDVVATYSGCHRSAVAEVLGASCVTVVDPVWGRDDLLWPVLCEVAWGMGERRITPPVPELCPTVEDVT